MSERMTLWSVIGSFVLSLMLAVLTYTLAGGEKKIEHPLV